MEIIVKSRHDEFEPYIVRGVVNIINLIGTVIIQYIGEDSTPHSLSFDVSSDVSITALVL